MADYLLAEVLDRQPEQVRRHAAAAGWFAGHGFPAEAIGHAQAAGDWGLAARLLAGHWPDLYLDGQADAIHELLAGFPAALLSADAELAAVAAADELAQGSLETAERYLDLAAQRSESSVYSMWGRRHHRHPGRTPQQHRPRHRRPRNTASPTTRTR